MRKPRLVPGWKLFLRRAWSVRLHFVAAAFAVVQGVLPLFADDIRRSTFALITAVVIFGGVIASIIEQKNLP